MKLIKLRTNDFWLKPSLLAALGPLSAPLTPFSSPSYSNSLVIRMRISLNVLQAMKGNFRQLPSTSSGRLVLLPQLVASLPKLFRRWTPKPTSDEMMDGDALHSGWLLTRWRPLFTWIVCALQLSIDLICEDVIIADYWATKSEISGNRNVPILSLYRIRTLNRLDQSAIKHMSLRLRSHLMVNTSIDTRNVTFQNTLRPLYFYSFLHGQSNSRWHHVPASSFKVGQHD